MLCLYDTAIPLSIFWSSEEKIEKEKASSLLGVFHTVVSVNARLNPHAPRHAWHSPCCQGSQDTDKVLILFKIETKHFSSQHTLKSHAQPNFYKTLHSWSESSMTITHGLYFGFFLDPQTYESYHESFITEIIIVVCHEKNQTSRDCRDLQSKVRSQNQV